jgi:hypothetical protein
MGVWFTLIVDSFRMWKPRQEERRLSLPTHTKLNIGRLIHHGQRNPSRPRRQNCESELHNEWDAEGQQTILLYRTLRGSS